MWLDALQKYVMQMSHMRAGDSQRLTTQTAALPFPVLLRFSGRAPSLCAPPPTLLFKLPCKRGQVHSIPPPGVGCTKHAVMVRFSLRMCLRLWSQWCLCSWLLCDHRCTSGQGYGCGHCDGYGQQFNLLCSCSWFGLQASRPCQSVRYAHRTYKYSLRHALLWEPLSNLPVVAGQPQQLVSPRASKLW